MATPTVVSEEVLGALIPGRICIGAGIWAPNTGARVLDSFTSPPPPGSCRRYKLPVERQGSTGTERLSRPWWHRQGAVMAQYCLNLTQQLSKGLKEVSEHGWAERV